MHILYIYGTPLRSVAKSQVGEGARARSVKTFELPKNQNESSAVGVKKLLKGPSFMCTLYPQTLRPHAHLIW